MADSVVFQGRGHHHEPTDLTQPESVNIETVENDTPSSRGTSPSPPSSKRKRDVTQTSELEINIALPEPPSKKALRKAKKQKHTAAATSETEHNNVRNADLPDINVTSIKEDNSTGEFHDVTGAGKAATKKRNQYGVWIGNLPFSATKEHLLNFLTSTPTADHGQIPGQNITRVHLPAPSNAKASSTASKPKNRGFAYVDFATEEAWRTALALSESAMGGRRLLIKDAKSFEGRPEKTPPSGKKGASEQQNGYASKEKKPTRRVFVGNLGFDVMQEDLEKHFGTCGYVENVHMATFEDSGKCKGFAWVLFSEVEAAEAAVKGWTLIHLDNTDDDTHEDEDLNSRVSADGGKTDDTNDTKENEAVDGNTSVLNEPKNKKKKPKPRKWFVNRLHGRPLRCEFAEDPSLRYRKRFGRDESSPKQAEASWTESDLGTMA